MRRLAAWTFLACGSSTGVFADEARWYAQIANDVVFGTDRWYSSGVRIAREKDGIEWGLVQDVYMPEAQTWHPGKDDRAPTARLLGSVAFHDRSPGSYQTIELALGVRGPSALGDQVTSAVHHVFNGSHVDWSRQLPDRVDAQAALTRSQAIGPDALKIHYGATLGTQMAFAHAGFELRAGDRSLSSAPLRFAPTPPFAAGGAPGWSVYAGASARAVGRNELISRNYDALGAELSHRQWIGRAAAGVAWVREWGSLAFDIVQDGKEFDAQTAPQRFGSLAIHVAF